MTMLERLARRGHLGATAVLDAFNPDQPRDERGRWGEGNSSQTGAEFNAKSTAAMMASGAARRSGLGKDNFSSKPGISPETAKLHADAAKAHHEAARAAVPRSKMEKFHRQEAVKHEGQSTPLTHVEQMEKFRSQMSAAVKADKTHNMAGAVPLKQGPTQSGGYKGNPAAEGSRAVKEDDRARMQGQVFRPAKETRESRQLSREVDAEIERFNSRPAQANLTPRGPVFKPARETAASRAHAAEVDAVIERFNSRSQGGRPMSDRTKQRGYTTKQISNVLLRDKSFVDSLPPDNRKK